MGMTERLRWKYYHGEPANISAIGIYYINWSALWGFPPLHHREKWYHHT